MNIEENVPLGPLTTLKVGGPARFFVRAGSETEAAAAIEFAEARSLEVFVLGGGSNVLISDAGFDGLVVQAAVAGVTEHGAGEVTAGCGEDWDAFVEFCVDRGLAGVECLSGIPGFVGGTPVQNVGAYGQEVSETIASVRCFDRREKKFVDLTNSECGFAYRHSIFNSTERGRYVVLSVRYKLQENGAAKVVYKDLQERFAGRVPTLREMRDAVLEIRRSKSMVIDEGDPNSRSAGSFFKNPIVDRSVLDAIGPDTPHFPAGERVKIPAAWLIENAGFYKGYKLGNAGISTRHALALVNNGRATAAEIVRLKNRIQAAVESQFGITLVPEPVFVGF